MAIEHLVFGDADSKDYNIEVFFKDIDHTPKRVYERIEVPGRNGAVLIDEKRYEDVSVTYDCVALNDADRSSFVNALAAQIGYHRLQDSFNSDEFYSAVFDGDVDPNVTSDREKSTFSIYFTRSAQRFLVSGEDVIDVASGDTLTNPTLFDSSPLLAVEGYGTIGFNGYEIELENKTVGDVEMLSNYTSPSRGRANDTAVFTATLENTALLNVGDDINIGTVSASYTPVRSGESAVVFTGATVNSSQNFDSCTASIVGGRNFEILATMRNVAFVYGTASSSATGSASVTLAYGSGTSTTKTLTLKLDYDGDKTITITATGQGVTSSWNIGKIIKIPSVYGNSSQSALGHPTYIDCDLGEAYLIDSGIPVSLNPYIDLGSDLPKLASGTNEITYDNTITELNITPRWWKV